MCKPSKTWIKCKYLHETKNIIIDVLLWKARQTVSSCKQFVN